MTKTAIEYINDLVGVKGEYRDSAFRTSLHGILARLDEVQQVTYNVVIGDIMNDIQITLDILDRDYERWLELKLDALEGGNDD